MYSLGGQRCAACPKLRVRLYSVVEVVDGRQQQQQHLIGKPPME